MPGRRFPLTATHQKYESLFHFIDVTLCGSQDSHHPLLTEREVQKDSVGLGFGKRMTRPSSFSAIYKL